MTDLVKETPHVALLMGEVFGRFRESWNSSDWDGLRQSHIRVVECIASGGTRTTEIARRLEMTKQGAGQLASTLLDGGWVQQVADPVDGRARRLVLTESGVALRDRARARIAEIEREWKTEVGEADYATFRHVLQRLTNHRLVG